MRTYESKRIKMDGRMVTVTIEHDTDETAILRQAQAIKTARVEGMAGKSKGKIVARGKARGLRNGQTIFAGFQAIRTAQEKLGPFA